MKENYVKVRKIDYDEMLDTSTRVDVIQDLVRSGQVLEVGEIFEILGILVK